MASSAGPRASERTNAGTRAGSSNKPVPLDDPEPSDIDSQGFEAEGGRQSLPVSSGLDEAEVMAWVDSVACLSWDDE